MAHYTPTRYYGLRAYDWNAVIYQGSVYCDTGERSCLPGGITADYTDVIPIFAIESRDYPPVCDRCSHEHVYMAINDTNNQGVR